MNRDLRTLLAETMVLPMKMPILKVPTPRMPFLRMAPPGKHWLAAVGLTLLSVALPLTAQSGPVGRSAGSSQQVGSGSLTVATDGFFEHATLTVAGPEGYWLERDFEAGDQITVDLLVQGRLFSKAENGEATLNNANFDEVPSSRVLSDGEDRESLTSLPDGSFRYELVAVDVEGEVRITKGRFIAQGGVAVGSHQPQLPVALIGQAAPESSTESAGTPSGWQTKTSETLIADGILQVVNPGMADAVMSLAFNSPTIPNNVWNLIQESPAGDLHLEASGTLMPGSGATSLFIDRSSGAIGVNTSTPGANFEIDILGTSSSTSDLRLRSSFGSRLHLDSTVSDFDLTSGIASVPQFTVRDSAGTDVFIVEDGALPNSLVVDATGNVGVGTNTPVVPLAVVGSAGLAGIRVEETASDAAVEVMFNLVCDCAPGFRMNNTNNGVTWFFRHTTPGDFAFDTPGSPGLEAQLTAAGNLTLKGQIFTASSRTLKEKLRPMDGEMLLGALDSLDLYEWSYLGEDARHFGPMAEDFAEAYGLGRGPQKLAPSDVAGVALAGVKALRDDFRALGIENSSLKSENTVLKEQLAEIAARLDALESSGQ